MESSVELTGVSVGWGSEIVIDAIDLKIDFDRFNRRVPIVGRTGLGKTTLLYALAGQAMPKAGTIRWVLPGLGGPIELGPGEADSRAADLRERAFSFAFQDAMLVPYLTVEENIALPIRLRGRDLSSRALRAQSDEILTRFLIDGEDPVAFRARFPSELSGGQRQRMALAQALAINPTVLFSDEPTGNLDPRTRIEIMSLVDRWVEESAERIFVWITHHHEADEFATAPFVLAIERRGGRTIATARPSGDYSGPDIDGEQAQERREAMA